MGTIVSIAYLRLSDRCSRSFYLVVMVQADPQQGSSPFSKPRDVCLLCSMPFELLNDLGAAAPRDDLTIAQIGTRLHCPKRHAYCAECIARYFFSRLANEGESGVSGIPCPHCLDNDWRFDEQEAGRVLVPLV